MKTANELMQAVRVQRVMVAQLIAKLNKENIYNEISESTEKEMVAKAPSSETALKLLEELRVASATLLGLQEELTMHNKKLGIDVLLSKKKAIFGLISQLGSVMVRNGKPISSITAKNVDKSGTIIWASSIAGSHISDDDKQKMINDLTQEMEKTKAEIAVLNAKPA